MGVVLLAAGSAALVSATPASASTPWRASSPAALSTHGSTPRSISCPSTAFCAATGTYDTPRDNQESLLSTQRDGTWTSVAPRLPDDGNTSVLTSVDCAAAGKCTAVGTYGRPGNKNQGSPVAITLANGQWKATRLPLPTGADDSRGLTLESVSCPTAVNCVAVGGYNYGGDGSGDYYGRLIETLAHGKWTASTVPLPADAESGTASHLNSVSCSVVGTCVAVGGYNGDVDGNQHALLIESLYKGKWSASRAPLPHYAKSTDDNDELQTVACPTTDTCVALGVHNSVDSGFAETLRGGKWFAGVLPGGIVPAGISCAEAGNCTAVGVEFGKRNEARFVVLSGGKWHVSVAPAAARTNASKGTYLSAVSCSTPTNCTAVGEYVDKNFAHHPLVETRGSLSAPRASAHLSGAFSPGTATVPLGTTRTLSLTVHNDGPDPAVGAQAVVSVDGSCCSHFVLGNGKAGGAADRDRQGRVVSATFHAGTLAPGQTIHIIVRVRAAGAGTSRLDADLSSQAVDPVCAGDNAPQVCFGVSAQLRASPSDVLADTGPSRLAEQSALAVLLLLLGAAFLVSGRRVPHARHRTR